MKRVKIMLSAILVMAVVGGALAFKAYKSPNVCVYSTTAPANSGAVANCPSIAQGVNTRVIDPTAATIYVSTLPAANCPATTDCFNGDLEAEVIGLK